MNNLLSPAPLWQQQGIALMRIMVGVLMIYHGLETFDQDKMKEYTRWMVERSYPTPVFMAYLGKVAELVSGLLLTLGLFTRLAAVILAATMLFITFGIGRGRFYMEDQHPFLFVLLALVFFFTGPGKWSLDRSWFGKK